MAVLGRRLRGVSKLGEGMRYVQGKPMTFSAYTSTMAVLGGRLRRVSKLGEAASHEPWRYAWPAPARRNIRRECQGVLESHTRTRHGRQHQTSASVGRRCCAHAVNYGMMSIICGSTGIGQSCLTGVCLRSFWCCQQARDWAGRMAAGVEAMVSAMTERAQQPRPSEPGAAKP